MPSNRLLVILLALALFAASCSSSTIDVDSLPEDSDASDESAEDAAPAETTAPSTTTSPTTAPPETTVAPPETVPLDAGDDTEFAVKAEHAEYCGLAGQARIREAEMGEDGFFDPVRLEAFLADNLSLLEQASTNVPPEIAADFDVFLAGNYEIQRVLAENDFDFLAVVDEPAFSDPEFEAASDAMSDFGDTACGFVDEPEEAAGGNGGATAEDIALMEQILSTEAGRQIFADGFAESMGITEEEALCFMDQFGPAGLAAIVAMNESGVTDNQIVADTFEAFDACGIQP